MTHGNVVISATLGRKSRSERFLQQADLFLARADQALAQGDLAEAVENAYLAALRTAGWWVATSPRLSRRKRLPASAWEKLKLDGVRGARWAESFRPYSRLRARVGYGGLDSPPERAVRDLLDLAKSFYDAAVTGEGAALRSA